MELREQLARAISKWPMHIDGFEADPIYSEEARERWKQDALSLADALLRLIAANDGHDSDCATHNMPAIPNGSCDCTKNEEH